ncbi:hypothetical protein [Marinomonas primoryensis]|uniref:Major facilitator superfamily (MFS) profile domain-containing protein n=1 Tax=Marinomonas primoryensis TaxID=178399 RepID=A0ABV0L565_9GAMM
MKDVSIKGIILAASVATTIDWLSAAGAGLLFRALISFQPFERTIFFMYLIYLIIGTFSTIFGGYIAASIGKKAPYKNALIFGVLGVVLALIMILFTTRTDIYPLWYSGISFFGLIPFSLLGAYLFLRKKSSRNSF